MALPTSPFHRGEQEAQNRVGVRAIAESLGQRMVRDFMPDQHREFYNQLPVLFVGSVDKKGQPWASAVVGKPGFVQSPNPRMLKFSTELLPQDPLSQGLGKGAQIGILGLEFHTRRRNRMNGEIVSVNAQGFEVEVGQSFGNCPQYIQKRRLTWRERTETTFTEGEILTQDVKKLVSEADTLFIATTFDEQGTDVSHRGGKPGFVKVENDRILVFPDFRGNNHFNTIGNILVNPKAGLLFFDYNSGDVLYLTTQAEIVWEGPEVEAFEGAQRLVRFTVLEWRLVKGSFPFFWEFEEYSPSLNDTGQWEDPSLREYTVSRIETESSVIKSFYLRPQSGSVPNFEAGQHLPVHLPVESGSNPVIRNYSLSQAPGRTELRISVKREEKGVGSNYLHDSVEVGSKLYANAPAGDFVLDKGSSRPLVLLSAGVGITPMLSMLQTSVNDNPDREVFFIHGARNGEEHALRSEVEALGNNKVNLHFRYSRPNPEDSFHTQGRIDIELLKSLLPLGNYDFYLCGPLPFLESLFRGLKALGFPDNQIRFETFGDSVSFSEVEAQEVEFRAFGKTITWNGGTLLELAEKSGISAPFSCRSGSCGACSRRLLSGEIEYLRDPSFETDSGEILLCSAQPADNPEEPLVIDL